MLVKCRSSERVELCVCVWYQYVKLESEQEGGGSDAVSPLFWFSFRQVHVGVEDIVDPDLKLSNFVLD